MDWKNTLLRALKVEKGMQWLAAPKLKADKRIVTEVVKQNGGALQFAVDELKVGKSICQAERGSSMACCS